MVTVNLGCMPKSWLHFLHLTQAGTRTDDGNNGFLKKSVQPQVGDEASIRLILRQEHTGMYFNVLLKLRIARSRMQ